MEIARPYDGTPRNPLKRIVKRHLEGVLGAVQRAPGYSAAVRAFDAVTGADGSSWQRRVMYQETRKLVESLGPEGLSALEISGDRWGELVKFKSYRMANYPEYDLCTEPLPEQFDLIIADQVFEHLLWPYRAARNVYAMLRPGGYFLVMTPFLVRVHHHPTDCSRWTETGMKHFLAECGFPLENTRTGSWGNLQCVKAELTAFRQYRRWFFHSLGDQHQFPIQVWALARK